MRHRLVRLAAFLAILLSPDLVLGQPQPTFPYADVASLGVAREQLSWLGNEINTWVGSGELVGAELLVARSGQVIHHEAYGWSDREARRPLERNSIFTIQSMSKPFTAAAILTLVDEGLLSLDDPVRRHVPRFPNESTTIHHLLTHTSGFDHEPDWYDHESPEGSVTDLVEGWPYREPEAPLGTYQYSDFNYSHLAYVISQLTELTAEAYITRKLLRPLGLDDTSTGFSSAPEWRSRLSAWYRWNDETDHFDLRWSRDWSGWTFYPGGWGLLSTAMDYAQWVATWMNGGEWNGSRILSEELVNLALQPHAQTGQGLGYGYGWEVEPGPDGHGVGSFWHGGGHGTLAIAVPDDEMIVIYLTQSRWGTHRNAFWNRLYMSGLLNHPGLGIDYGSMAWAEEVDLNESRVSAENVQETVGTYLAAEEGAVQALEIWEEGGLLHLRIGRRGAEAEPRFHLVPLESGGYAIGRYEGLALRAADPAYRLRITHDEEGQVGLELLKDGEVVTVARRVS